MHNQYDSRHNAFAALFLFSAWFAFIHCGGPRQAVDLFRGLTGAGHLIISVLHSFDVLNELILMSMGVTWKLKALKNTKQAIKSDPSC